MDLEARMNNLEQDVKQLQTRTTELCLDVGIIKTHILHLATQERIVSIATQISHLATKIDIIQSRNLIIYWLVGLFIISGVLNHLLPRLF